MLWAIQAVAVVAAAISEVILFRMFTPPDVEAALLGGAWVAMPFLGTMGLAGLVRRNPTALVVMLVSLLLAGFVGVSMLNASADALAESDRQVREAVLPGEDPHSGPAGMRKAGADAGAAIGTVFSIAVVVVVPPVQLAGVVIPTLIGYGVSALVRRRREGAAGARGRASFA